MRAHSEIQGCIAKFAGPADAVSGTGISLAAASGGRRAAVAKLVGAPGGSIGSRAVAGRCSVIDPKGCNLFKQESPPLRVMDVFDDGA